MSYDPGPTSDDVLLRRKGEGEAIEVSLHFPDHKRKPGPVVASWVGPAAVELLLADALIRHTPMGSEANGEDLREAALAHAKVVAPGVIIEYRERLTAAYERAAEGLGTRFRELQESEPVEREAETELPEDEEDREERLFLKTVREAMNRQDEFLGLDEGHLDKIEAHLLDRLEHDLCAGSAPRR